MSASVMEAVRSLVHSKGISEELILQTVEEILLVAYKKQFGSAENAETKINEKTGEVSLYSKKVVVEKVADKLLELSLEDARKANASCELDDEVLVEIKLKDLGRIAVQTSKQLVMQKLQDIEKNIIYSEYKQKVGEIVTGICQRKRNKHIFVDLGRTEAILPSYEQSSRESFDIRERIKTVIVEVRDDRETQVVLSRAAPMFVQRLFELDVPEINEGVIEIKGIVREAGYRTKIAVYSKDIDPVGPCVGMKGMRIQNIVKELEGEKIDIIRYKDDIKEYITNALSPAKVEQVVVLDEENQEALAVVEDSQLSLAIGKQGHNVKLASKLLEWDIDIKSTTEFAKTDYADASRRAAESLFVSDDDEYIVEEHLIEELEDLGEELIGIFKREGIDTIESLVDKSRKELLSIDGIKDEEADKVFSIIKENIVVVDDDKAIKDGEGVFEEDSVIGDTVEAGDMSNHTEGVAESTKVSAEEEIGSEEVIEGGKEIEDGKEIEYDEEFSYYCPDCNAEIAEGAVECPSCGVGLEFE